LGCHTSGVVINIEEYKTKDGNLDLDKLAVLRLKKPILQPVDEGRFRSFSVKLNRDPYDSFPDRLPTLGKLPLPIDEHEHIGMYENNQTLYLTMANAYNTCMERIETLKALVADLQAKLDNKNNMEVK